MELIRKLVDPRDLAETRLVVASANGSPGLDRLEAEIIRTVFEGGGETLVTAPKVVSGEFEASGIFRLALALSRKGIIEDTAAIFGLHSPSTPPAESLPSERELALLIGTSAGGGRAAVLLELLPRVQTVGIGDP